VKKQISLKVAVLVIAIVVVIAIIVGYFALGKKPGASAGGGPLAGKWMDSRSGTQPTQAQGGGGVSPEGTKMTGPEEAAGTSPLKSMAGGGPGQ